MRKIVDNIHNFFNSPTGNRVVGSAVACLGGFYVVRSLRTGSLGGVVSGAYLGYWGYTFLLNANQIEDLAGLKKVSVENASADDRTPDEVVG